MITRSHIMLMPLAMPVRIRILTVASEKMKLSVYLRYGCRFELQVQVGRSDANVHLHMHGYDCVLLVSTFFNKSEVCIWIDAPIPKPVEVVTECQRLRATIVVSQSLVHAPHEEKDSMSCNGDSQ